MSRDYSEALDRKKGMASARIVRRDRYAWPGGYALFVVFSDGGCACANCVCDNWHEISDATRNRDSSGWQVVGFSGLHETDETVFCDQCGIEIGEAH